MRSRPSQVPASNIRQQSRSREHSRIWPHIAVRAAKGTEVRVSLDDRAAIEVASRLIEELLACFEGHIIIGVFCNPDRGIWITENDISMKEENRPGPEKLTL